MPPHIWGVTGCTIEDVPEHVSARGIFVPEGLAMIACCLHCGARQERLIDASWANNETAAEALAKHETPRIAEVLQGWASEHHLCRKGAQLTADIIAAEAG